MPRLFAAVLAALCLTGLPVSVHEFWIAPAQYQLNKDAQLIADFRNGQDFQGTDCAYFESRTDRCDLIKSATAVPHAGRMGDLPALQPPITEDGLLVFFHQTAPPSLTYSEWGKFRAFTENKGFPEILDRPRAGGADQVMGMETEFVARANPHADDLSGDAQVEIFDRAPDGTVSGSTMRTDDQGQVPPGGKAVWDPLWAAMSFAVP